jgi:hypothetical protein
MHYFLASVRKVPDEMLFAIYLQADWPARREKIFPCAMALPEIPPATLY